MTVSQLIAALSRLPGDLPVAAVVDRDTGDACDADGVSLLHRRRWEDTWAGEDDEREDSPPDGSRPVVIIWT